MTVERFLATLPFRNDADRRAPARRAAEGGHLGNGGERLGQPTEAGRSRSRLRRMNLRLDRHGREAHEISAPADHDSVTPGE
jgi:hypothetical protein